MVLAIDENNPEGELAYREVTAFYTNYRNDIIKLYIGNLRIETTDNHPFYVEDKGWVVSDELQTGDKLQRADGSNLTIDRVEFVLLDESVMVYNFTVADYHTYYVTDLGIWVHNTKCTWVKDFQTKKTKQYSSSFKGEGHARAFAKEKLGKNSVYIGDNKYRSKDGKWQYRTKPVDTNDNHVHLEKLNPKTGEVIENWHLNYPKGSSR